MMSERQRSLNPAASRPRMVVALGILVVLGVSAWFTIDASAVVHVNGFSNSFVSFASRDIEIRWIPILIFCLFAFRIVLAHMRARIEERSLP